jgi:hypothetical protein
MFELNLDDRVRELVYKPTLESCDAPALQAHDLAPRPRIQHDRIR